MATGATEFIDNTTAAAFIATIWSKKAIIAREDALVLANLFDRQFESEMSFGQVIHVPGITNLAARQKTLASNAAITYETVTESNSDITVDQWWYAAFALETQVRKQQSQDLVKRYSPKMGFALGRKIEADLAGRFDDFSQTDGALGTPTSYSLWLRGVQYLDDANVPLEDRFMYISPAERKNLMEMDQFVHADYDKLNEGTKARADRGRIGTWLGIPLYMSTVCEGTNAAGHDNGLAHKSAVGLVVQIDMVPHNFFDIDYLADKYAIECLYGLAEMRDDHGFWAKGG